MRKSNHATLPEVVFPSTRNMRRWIFDARAKGTLREIGPRLFTTNLTDDPAAIIRRNLWRVVAAYYPDALIADRTALEARAAPDGSVFVISNKTRAMELPGLTIRPRRGMGPLASDRRFMSNLYLSSRPRALLENLRASRARGGDPRTLPRARIEEILAQDMASGGVAALNRTRDEAKAVALDLGFTEEIAALDSLIGALLGTRDAELETPVAIALASGRPYDPRRVDLLTGIAVHLSSRSPVIRKAAAIEAAGAANLAFFEAYFSNFIEGTEFPVEEARDIVFNNIIPSDRPEDAHDVAGTFEIVANSAEMRLVPASLEDFITLLRRRHAVVMAARPEKGPGRFKTKGNQAGGTLFVAPDLVLGTLASGFEIYRTLVDPISRAAFMMSVVSEVHPFADGNGRVARIMMNAELVAAGEQRIIVPIVYRNNYVASLKAMTNNADGEPLARVLDFAQRYTGAIPYESFDAASFVLAQTNAFLKSDEAEDNGIRLRLPTPELLQEAEDLYRPPPSSRMAGPR